MSDFSPTDHIAICETKARYCRCLDTKDWSGFADVFTQDLILDTTPSGGPEIQGREEAVNFVRSRIGEAITAHQIHAPEICFLDTDTADVIWAMQDRVLWPSNKTEAKGISGLTGFGHYHERYVRCPDGVWRIAKQKLTRLHMDFDRSTGA